MITHKTLFMKKKDYNGLSALNHGVIKNFVILSVLIVFTVREIQVNTKFFQFIVKRKIQLQKLTNTEIKYQILNLYFPGLGFQQVKHTQN